jgi:hypothetical protein
MIRMWDDDEFCFHICLAECGLWPKGLAKRHLGIVGNRRGEMWAP